MAITVSDISFVYSGGTNNTTPSKSIGGPPSINQLNTSLNNLFSDVNKEQSESGTIDYRCFYIFNDNENQSIFNANVYMKSQNVGLSSCQIGLSKATDVQVLSFDPIPNAGNFKISYENYTTNLIHWNNNHLIFQKNIQDALNNLDLLSGVVVERIFNNSYRISFLGDDNYRNHSLLSISNNSLSPSTSAQFTKTSQGQPINSTAPLLPTGFTTPTGVVFYDTSNETKIFIGDLGPKDGVPIWIKRTTLGSVSNNQQNGFQFRLSGNLIKDSTIQPFNDKPCFFYE